MMTPHDNPNNTKQNYISTTEEKAREFLTCPTECVLFGFLLKLGHWGNHSPEQLPSYLNWEWGLQV